MQTVKKLSNQRSEKGSQIYRSETNGFDSRKATHIFCIFVQTMLEVIFVCTAISELGSGHLFGRTLDLECSYNECVCIVPRGFEIKFLHEQSVSSYAIIGTCHIEGEVPLFYDAMNECGLCMAGLNFPELAKYNEVVSGQINVASYELIAFVLRQCKDASSAVSLLKRINITSESFSASLPCTHMHWIIADKSGCYVIEQTKRGLEIYENPLRVLTNAPEFSYHLTNACNYMGLSSNPPKSTLTLDYELSAYSRGLGAFGLPGDFSSASRLVRAVFAKNHASADSDEIRRFFSILNTVYIPLGCVKTDTGRDVCTIYTSCMSSKTGNYYFSLYGSKRIMCVRLYDVNLNGNSLFVYDMRADNEYKFLN